MLPAPHLGNCTKRIARLLSFPFKSHFTAQVIKTSCTINKFYFLCLKQKYTKNILCIYGKDRNTMAILFSMVYKVPFLLCKNKHSIQISSLVGQYSFLPLPRENGIHVSETISSSGVRSQSNLSRYAQDFWCTSV